MAKTATALAILGLWLFATSSVSAQSGAAQACGDANSSADQTISACGQLIKSGALHGNDLAIAYNNRGVGYLDKGQLDDAIADFTQALRADPSYVPAYLDRAIAYAKKEQAEPAIADYTQALRIDPKLGDAYYNRGVIYQDTARDDLAIADFTQALRFQPNNAVAYYYRGLAYHRKGQNDLASADFTQALRINPNFAAAKSALQNLTH